MLNILVCTDFSEAGDRAVSKALELWKNEANITLLHCVEPPPTPNPMYAHYVAGTAWDAQTRELVASAAESGLERLAQGHENVRTMVAMGPPVHEIVSTAERLDIDIIVVGTHGRTGVKRMLMGSVAEMVIRTGSRPVLVVH